MLPLVLLNDIHNILSKKDFAINQALVMGILVTGFQCLNEPMS